MALRGIARERFEPGEHFVGWAMASTDAAEWARAVAAFAAMAPGAGVLAAMPMARPRLLVLSDRRLWLLDPRARSALWPENLAPCERLLGAMSFELIGSAATAEDIGHFEEHAFQVMLRGDPRPRTVRSMIQKRGASRRLPEAFRVLARPREGPGGYPADGDAREPSTDRRPHPL